ncbi:GNAT family N-acetyltransferase [Rasiella rasia]|uniref:GNAT family N-acetyltransferase n=1 Tax=Rasiella rasia TaxID=2744027 RepID=A0A6G6GQR7_9FLAO|nr:GNAT family N-acetyltransferase [Rasiella rasia]
MITYHLSSSDYELEQILDLQKRNLFASLTEEEQKTEGFVTVQHDFDLLKAMHDKCPHVLAKDGTEVVGYALSMHPDFGNDIEVLRPMFEQIYLYYNSIESARKLLHHNNFIVMGQICIAKEYRQQGIFRKLYKNMQSHLPDSFSTIITEVDAKNQRSLNAHLSVGFKELKRYNSGTKQWVLLYLL